MALQPSVALHVRHQSLLLALLVLSPGLGWVPLPGSWPKLGIRADVRSGSSCRVARRVAGATIDRPPPPADLDDGDGDGEEYVVRFMDNAEREQVGIQWLTMASEEERDLLEKQVLPFRSSKMFTGKSRLCVGAFVGNSCVGMATTEVKMDVADFAAFFMDKRVLRCLALVTKPRVRTEAGAMILKAVKQLADESGYRTDFEPLQQQSSGRYWVLARSLFET
eukprot:gb/GFBE01027676.1/.p1 GENE.gb/GFBE01027676.1/~~gb/GFBE01027676.1/.p1  ORF type:complete len:222 (+),score=46.58 gb/GFBE01027676.1/:1-666(+)